MLRHESPLSPNEDPKKYKELRDLSREFAAERFSEELVRRLGKYGLMAGIGFGLLELATSMADHNSNTFTATTVAIPVLIGAVLERYAKRSIESGRIEERKIEILDNVYATILDKTDISE